GRSAPWAWRTDRARATRRAGSPPSPTRPGRNRAGTGRRADPTVAAASGSSSAARRSAPADWRRKTASRDRWTPWRIRVKRQTPAWRAGACRERNGSVRRPWTKGASGPAWNSVLRVLGDVPVHRRLVAGAAVLLLLDVVDLDGREVQRDVLGQAILAARAA